MTFDDPTDVLQQMIVVSRELLRLGDSGQPGPPTPECAVLRAQRDALHVEIRTQLRAAAGISFEAGSGGDQDAIATVRPPQRGPRLIKASAPPADSPSPGRAPRKESP